MNANIPKVIHYCWFGPRNIPDLELRCIESWRENLPEFELKFWNENSTDIKENNFATQAYENAAYAFVSDYVRVKALYEYGGIYLDTDVEVLKPLNKLLNANECLLGFETRSHVGTAVMRFTPKHPLIKQFLDFYQSNNFVNRSGDVNTIANVKILTDILRAKGLNVDGTFQELDGIKIFPREYFYPKKISDMNFAITDKTVSIHKFSASWLSERERKRGNSLFWINFMRPMLRGLRTSLEKMLGGKVIQKLEIRVRNILK